MPRLPRPPKGQFLADRGQSAFRRSAVERHAATEEESRVVIAQPQIGVGDGGVRASAAVVGRAGVGTGRLRADLKQSDLIDGGERPTRHTACDLVTTFYAYL
jgi:hypothetical protein